MRVRNHAKMVDCYLTTFKNNKGYFGDKKKIAQDIIGIVRKGKHSTVNHSNVQSSAKWYSVCTLRYIKI